MSYYFKKIIDHLSICFHHRDQLEELWLKNNLEYLKGPIVNKNRPPYEVKRNVVLRWGNTLWCNYKCPYCNQVHSRKKENHAFDVASPDIWARSIDKHFGGEKHNLLMVITGGEPLLDVNNMRNFLNEICTRDYLMNIRIDTNLSWQLSKYDSIEKKEKIWLMCTFHPSHSDEKKFFNKVIEAKTKGYNIGICNYVITKDSISDYRRIMLDLLEADIPLHPNPLWDNLGKYDDRSLSLLKKHLPEKDYFYRTSFKKPYRKECLFPAIAYQMNSRGDINVGCHRHLLKTNLLKNNKLPALFSTYTKCPFHACNCLDQYSFLKGFNRNFALNPLYSYSKQLLDLYTNSANGDLAR